ncbi:uncharacterized protein DMAD_11087 [Drosophila madeirensis]|uniref:Uncharacterized protein n=1 Tax=Drosophila madeirensis TaxID=30013 RepID=A0AAU9FC08_DROMD
MLAVCCGFCIQLLKY